MTDRKFAQLSFDAGSVFTPGSPINERDLFAGRVTEIHKILDAISQRGYHAVLYGERGVGKTSLSNVLSGFLSETGARNFLVPRVNCDASDSYSSLWRKALQDIVVSKARPGIGFGANEIEETQQIVESLPRDITPDDVRRVLTRLSAGLFLIVIFDEFDRLKDRSVTVSMADTVKALSDYAVGATILLIGVADSVDELIQEHQSIERALVQVPMPRMSEDEIREIIENGLGRLNMTISEQASDEITSLSQGIPYITHLLALHSARAALREDKTQIDFSHVEAGISKALDQWQQSIKSAYYNATKSQQPGNIFKEVLLACALSEIDDLGYFTAAAVRIPLRIITGRQYDIPNFARHLKELSEPGRGDMLQRVGQTRRLRYRFRSPIIRPYIVMRGFAENLLTRDQMHSMGL
jgi:Cdc6-like AAA superfamily ATPase